MEAIEFGPNHRRGIRITLAHLDEIICLVERLTDSEGKRSVLYAEKNTLSESQREEIRSEVAGLRDLLGELRETLHLQPVTRDAGKVISGHCMTLWQSIIELQGKYLKRYGEPPEELVKYLDPKTEEISRHLNEIIRIIGVFRMTRPTDPP